MPTSYNGWPAAPNPADFGGISPLVVAGESFAPGVRSGDVHTVFQHLAEQLHRRVEPVVRPDWHQADDWGFAYRKNVNANNLSCHASGTAIDYNATRHPNGRRGTFSSAQVAEIRAILAELDGAVRWGGDFPTPDEMHFEIAASRAQVAAVARRLTTPTPTPTTPEDDMGGITYLVRTNDSTATYHDKIERRGITYCITSNGSDCAARYVAGGELLALTRAQVPVIELGGRDFSDLLRRALLPPEKR